MNVRKVDTFSGHRDSVYTIISDGTAHGFYSAGGDGYVIRWDLKTPDLGRLVARAGASVYAMALDEKGEKLWVGQNYEGIQLINVADNSVEKTSRITGAAIFDIQIAGDTALIATGDGVIIVMDIPSFSVKKHIKISGKSVRSIAVNAAAQEFAAGDSEFNVHIFSLADFTLKKTLQAHTNSVFTVNYSNDGQKLFTAGRDAHIKIWDANDAYAPVADIPAHMYAINDIAFSPDGALFATCSMDKSVKLWETSSLKLKKIIDRARHAGHGTSVNKLLWTSFENQLVSCSDDRMISVWEVI